MSSRKSFTLSDTNSIGISVVSLPQLLPPPYKQKITEGVKKLKTKVPV